MAKHKFLMDIQWPGGRNDVGRLEASKLKTAISIPEEMEGPGIGTNPDEMLLGASATCYIISLAAMLERSGIDAVLKLQSEGIVDVSNGVFTYEQIIHHVSVTLADRTTRNEQVAERLVHKAEKTCMISKALKGNVEISVNLTLI